MLYTSLPTKWSLQSKKGSAGSEVLNFASEITNEDTTKVTFQLAWPSTAKAFKLQEDLNNLDVSSHCYVMKSSNLELEGSDPANCQLQ